MKPKIITIPLLFLFLSISEASHAANWISLGELESGGSAYIDISSIKREGRYVKYWITVNIPWNKNPLDFSQIVESMSQHVADCSRGEIQKLQSREKDSGGYTYSSNNRGPLHDPAPGTIEEGAMNKACELYTSRRR